jgi:hypothetical protein
VGEAGGFAKGDTVLGDGDEESVAVRKLPWRDVETSSPRRWDSMRWSSWRAWKAQKEEWAGLRSMWQQRSSENWNRQRGAMLVLGLLFVMEASWSGFVLMRTAKLENRSAKYEMRNTKLEVRKSKCEIRNAFWELKD